MSRWVRAVQATAAAVAVVGGYVASRAWRARPEPRPPSKAERKAARKAAVARATARRGG